nr:uncharacterized protein LOC108128215 [Drosophila bipectinata]
MSKGANQTCIKISSKYEFTNIKCTSLDETFVGFEYCYLKSVNRSYKYLSVKANLLKTPVTKVSFIVFKKHNGYRPFMFNITIDGCRFMGGATTHSLANYLYGFIRPYTNINHRCPYDHDIMVEKLDTDFMNYQVTKILPVPEGDYYIESRWNSYDVVREVIKVYGTIS